MMDENSKTQLLRTIVAHSPALQKAAVGALAKIREIAHDYRDDPAVGLYHIQDLVTPKEDHYHG